MPEYLGAADAKRDAGVAGLTARPEIAISRDHSDALPRLRDGDLDLCLEPRPRSPRTQSWLQRQLGVLPGGSPAHDRWLCQPVQLAMQLDVERSHPGDEGPRPPAG